MAKARPADKATRESWALAALAALSQAGVDAVAVEPLAKSLGVTKGSFYWHFGSRADLLEAALELWERRGTTDVIASLSEIEDPAERLRQLFRRVARLSKGASAQAALSSAKEPSVRRTLQRVAEARLAFLSQCYGELGMSKAVARRHAFLAYAAYLGMIELGRDAPSEMQTSAKRDAYVAHMIDVLVPSELA